MEWTTIVNRILSNGSQKVSRIISGLLRLCWVHCDFRAHQNVFVHSSNYLMRWNSIIPTSYDSIHNAQESIVPVHGSTCCKKVQNIRPQGSMFGAGYRTSFETNKILVTYAPRQTQAALKKFVLLYLSHLSNYWFFPRFESTAEDLQDVLISYREAFGSLFGSAFKQISKFSIKWSVLSLIFSYLTQFL